MTSNQTDNYRFFIEICLRKQIFSNAKSFTLTQVKAGNNFRRSGKVGAIITLKTTFEIMLLQWLS